MVHRLSEPGVVSFFCNILNAVVKKIKHNNICRSTVVLPNDNSLLIVISLTAVDSSHTGAGRLWGVRIWIGKAEVQARFRSRTVNLV